MKFKDCTCPCHMFGSGMRYIYTHACCDQPYRKRRKEYDLAPPGSHRVTTSPPWPERRP